VSSGKALQQWIDLVSGLGLDVSKLSGKDARLLLNATNKKQPAKVSEIAMKMYQEAS
jgi:hypothetical protein